MRAIEICRTAALGGHVESCRRCGHRRNSYNSCRNRHCPKCQNAARAAWVARRKADLLPVPYFHLVFTIPQELYAIALQNARTFYHLLFQTSAQTLLTIAADPQHLGARIGFFSVLHTWGQKLLFHPHIHCVVTGGGLAPDGSWTGCRPGFFLSVRVLSRLFRRLFLQALESAQRGGRLAFHGTLAEKASEFPQLLAQLRSREWVVYAKPPFGGPAQAIEYLGRYSHRVAISNERLDAIHGDQVSFHYKDYRVHGRQKMRHMTLAGDEFIRRFLLHALPPRFPRIRHYGLLSGRNKKALLETCRHLLEPAAPPLPSPAEIARYHHQITEKVRTCPRCGGEMIRIERLAPIPFVPQDSS
jgi:hypothetical protein